MEQAGFYYYAPIVGQAFLAAGFLAAAAFFGAALAFFLSLP